MVNNTTKHKKGLRKPQKRSHSKKLAVNEAKRVAKDRDDWTCVRCGRSREQGWRMHGAHIMPVEWDGTAADPDNILTLCATCHSIGRASAHEDPVSFARWLDEKYPGLYDRMHQQAYKYSKNPFPKIDWTDVRDKLKQL